MMTHRVTKLSTQNKQDIRYVTKITRPYKIMFGKINFRKPDLERRIRKDRSFENEVLKI